MLDGVIVARNFVINSSLTPHSVTISGVRVHAQNWSLSSLADAVSPLPVILSGAENNIVRVLFFKHGTDGVNRAVTFPSESWLTVITSPVSSFHLPLRMGVGCVGPT
jgi:hypothetical protein